MYKGFIFDFSGADQRLTPALMPLFKTSES